MVFLIVVYKIIIPTLKFINVCKGLNPLLPNGNVTVLSKFRFYRRRGKNSYERRVYESVDGKNSGSKGLRPFWWTLKFYFEEIIFPFTFERTDYESVVGRIDSLYWF